MKKKNKVNLFTIKLFTIYLVLNEVINKSQSIFPPPGKNKLF